MGWDSTRRGIALVELEVGDSLAYHQDSIEGGVNRVMIGLPWGQHW